MRSITGRSGKYQAKIDGGVAKQRYDAQRQEMIRKESDAIKDGVQIEKEVKTLLPTESSFDIVYYIVFAKEVRKLNKKFSGAALIEELEILQRKWYTRGLDLRKLNKLKHFYIERYVEGSYWDSATFDAYPFV